MLDARGLALGERGQLVGGGGDAAGEVLAQLVRQRSVGLLRHVHAVDDQAAERHRGVGQLAVEEDRLLDGVVARRGDDHERRARVLEQRADAAGALGEAVDHPAERAEEDRQVVQQVDARQPLEQPEDDAGAAAQQPAADPGRPDEHLDRTALEEGGQPARRVEEVERVARRRGVEHEQVVVALLVELVELGDRGELLRAGDRARELLVDPVGEHLVTRRRVRRQALDQRVEGALGVEHQRPQLAADLDAVLAEALGVDEPRLVAELLEPERVGEPPRRVDRHHRDLEPALGHAHRDRGRRGGLPDAARAGAHHDPAAFEQLEHPESLVRLR